MNADNEITEKSDKNNLELTQSEYKKAREKMLLEKKSLRVMLDSVDNLIYIADPETFELLYANKTFKNYWQLQEDVGGKCYTIIHKRTSPCSFCTNNEIFCENLGKTHKWEYQSELTGDWLQCTDKAIEWYDGRKVRFQQATNISELKNVEEDLNLSYSPIL